MFCSLNAWAKPSGQESITLFALSNTTGPSGGVRFGDRPPGVENLEFIVALGDMLE